MLAELFLDGQPLFDYSRLLAYRLGSSQAPLAALDKVHHSVRGMVAHMVQRDPAARHTVQQYLQVSLLHAAQVPLGLCDTGVGPGWQLCFRTHAACRPRLTVSSLQPHLLLLLLPLLLQEASSAALPGYLATSIHPFFAAALHLDTDARVALVSQGYAQLKAQLLGGEPAAGGSPEGVASLAPRLEERQVEGQQPGGPTAAAGDAAAGDVGGSSSGSRPPLEQTVAGLLSEAQASLKQLEGRSSSSSRGGTPHLTPRDRSTSSSQAEQGSGQQQQQQATPQVQDGAAAGSHPALSSGSGSGSTPPVPQTSPPPPVADQHHALQPQAQQPQQQHEGMVLVAVLLCTLLRGSRLQEHKARVVSLLCDSAAFCDDETRLQRVLPYLVAATAEPLAAVKCVALRAIARVLAQVREGVCVSIGGANSGLMRWLIDFCMWQQRPIIAGGVSASTGAGGRGASQRSQGVQRVPAALPLAAALGGRVGGASE